MSRIKELALSAAWIAGGTAVIAGMALAVVGALLGGAEGTGWTLPVE